MSRQSQPDRRTSTEPFRVGRRLLVTPAGGQATPQHSVHESDLIELVIDADSAFGSGAHPTTRLCLAALERHLTPGTTLLDLGCGSGILSIAAAKLGAQSVLAVDIDQDAVTSARRNAAANGCAQAIRVEAGSLADVRTGAWGPVQAQTVVVNILAHVILDFFAEGLDQCVTPGGLLILAGILRTQTPGIKARLHWHALEILAMEQAGEWVCLIVRRPANEDGDHVQAAMAGP